MLAKPNSTYSTILTAFRSLTILRMRRTLKILRTLASVFTSCGLSCSKHDCKQQSNINECIILVDLGFTSRCKLSQTNRSTWLKMVVHHTLIHKASSMAQLARLKTIRLKQIITLYAYRSLKDHGKLVIKSNQKPPGDARYLALMTLKLSQYVSEMSRIPVQNWRHIST
jgi:hypothetical protein